MPADLTKFKVISFDCYGTLIDWETGILAALAPLRAKLDGSVSDQDLLRLFGEFESELEATQPATRYPDILCRVHGRMAERLSVHPDFDDASAFGQSVGDWPAFPDSTEAVRRLQDRYKLAILSNVDRASFSRSQKRLGVSFDYVFTAEDIGSYKPDLRNFEYMLAHLAREGYGQADILHAAQSLFHDHVPANRMGLRSVWINRQEGRAGATLMPDPMPRFDHEFPSLGAFASACTAA